MIPVSPEFVIGSLFTSYAAGWAAGFIILNFKQLFDKI